MAELSGRDIALGKGGRPLTAPAQRSGRWRCHLCLPLRWRRGTEEESALHYLTYHYEPPKDS